MKESKTLEKKQKKPRVYTVGDLFFTEWKQLTARTHAFVFSQYLLLKRTKKETIDYGLTLISILRTLRKNKRLVDRINEEQAVDIFNDLKEVLLSKPWYYFHPCPKANGQWYPSDYLSCCSFDQFIFADNEFTSLLAKEDPNYLKRLAATLYQQDFKKETVDELSGTTKQPDGNLIVTNDLPPMRFKNYELEYIFFTYMNVREFVAKRCKHLLPKAVSTKESAEEKQKPSGPMWHEIKHSAARTLVFGSFEELGKADMYDVLDHLELLAKQKDNANT